MTELIARLVLFTVLPVLLGGALVVLDRTATGPVRRSEAFLVPLFLVGVGGGGLTAFIAHVFMADAASPFQREVGFANLAIGLLGAVAAERRDGFREAAVGAAAVFGLGAAWAHLMDVTAAGDALAAILRVISRLVVPALLIWFLLALRRAERTEEPTIVLRSWMIPVRRGSVAAVGIAAAAFSVGYPTGQAVALSLAGLVVATVVFWLIVSRAASHRASAET